MDRTSVMIQNSIASDDYQPNPAFRQNAAPHARMRKKPLMGILICIDMCIVMHIDLCVGVSSA